MSQSVEHFRATVHDGLFRRIQRCLADRVKTPFEIRLGGWRSYRFGQGEPAVKVLVKDRHGLASLSRFVGGEGKSAVVWSVELDVAADARDASVGLLTRARSDGIDGIETDLRSKKADRPIDSPSVQLSVQFFGGFGVVPE